MLFPFFFVESTCLDFTHCLTCTRFGKTLSVKFIADIAFICSAAYIFSYFSKLRSLLICYLLIIIIFNNFRYYL